MRTTPRHATTPARNIGTGVVACLCLLTLVALALTVPQLLTDAEALVKLLAFLIDVVRITLRA